MRINPEYHKDLGEHTIEVGAQKRKVDVWVNGSGVFLIEIDGLEIEARTLKDALRKAEEGLKKKKIRFSLPISHWTTSDDWWGGDKPKHKLPMFEDYIAIGLHASNGNVLIRRKGRKTGSEQVSYHSGSWLRKLTAAEKKELLALWEAKEMANKLFDERFFEFAVDLEEIAKKEYERLSSGG